MGSYTSAMGNQDLKRFGQECGQFYNQEVVQRVPQVVKFSAAVTIHQLLKRSPVLTGSYILSHQLTKHYIGSTYTIRKQVIDPKTGETIRQSKSMMRRLARTRLFQKLRGIQVRLGEEMIQLSNSIPYADQVEYGFATGARGYRVYGLAYENARVALNRILGSIQTTIWDKPMDSQKIDAIVKQREMEEVAAAANEICDILGRREQMARDQGYKVD
ncbi:MAG: hypothetical protein MIO92_09590 [Methanosarcinaceae archaeon]|nr:hypothetical protein [Methanosarcinaceae archaeon]